MGYQPRSTDKRSCGVCRREHSQDLGVYDVSAFRRVESKDFRLQGLGQVYNCLYEPTLRQTFSSGGLGILRPSTQAANTGTQTPRRPRPRKTNPKLDGNSSKDTRWGRGRACRADCTIGGSIQASFWCKGIRRVFWGVVHLQHPIRKHLQA